MKSTKNFILAYLLGLLTLNITIAVAALLAAYTNVAVTMVGAIMTALVCIVASIRSHRATAAQRGAVMLAACVALGPSAICSTNIYDYFYAQRGEILKGVSLAEAVNSDDGRIFYLTNGIVMRDYEGTHIWTGNSHNNRTIRTFYRAAPIVADTFVDTSTMRFDTSTVTVKAWAVRSSAHNDASVLVDVPGTDTVTATGTDADGRVYTMAAIRAGRNIKDHRIAIAASLLGCGITTTETPLILELFASPEEALAGYLADALLACQYFNMGWVAGYPLLSVIAALVMLRKRRKASVADRA